MNIQHEQLRLNAEAQAGEWFVRHRDGRLGSAETAEFTQWLQASPLHVQEYLAAARVATVLPGAVQSWGVDRDAVLRNARDWLHGGDRVVSLPQQRAGAAVRPGGRARRVGLFAAAAAVAALVVSVALYWTLGPVGVSGLPRTLDAPRGEQHTVSLLDGSVVHLNADSRLRVRYSGAQRLIELERGQALFNVARDAQRPFVVRAGATEVVAIGTQFDVLRQDSQRAVTVTVVEGRVEVRSPSSVAISRPVRLDAGQQLRVAKSELVSQVKSVDTRLATAWLRRELIFTEQRLADVAEEFSRYGVPIEIEDPQLRAYRVSGVFNAYDTDSFVTFLRRFGEVEQTGRVIRVRPVAESAAP